MKRGPKAETPSTKLARGTFQPVRDGLKTEIVVPGDPPVRPDYLSAAAIEVWQDVIGRVMAAGVTEADSNLLARYCALEAEVRAAFSAKDGELPSAAYLTNLVTASWPGRDQNSFFVMSTGLPQNSVTPPATDAGMSIPVDSPVFTQTDYPAASTIAKTPTSLKITRPIADGLNYRLASPNARDRTRATLSWVEWVVMHGAPGNMPEPKAPLVTVDGAPVATTVSNAGAAGAYTIRAVPGAGLRTVEMVWPYEGPMEIIARRVSGTRCSRPHRLARPNCWS